MKMLNEDINKLIKKASLVVLIFFLALFIHDLYHFEIGKKSLLSGWEKLEAKSEAHGVLVGAYLDCLSNRQKVEVECFLMTDDYAKLKGLEAEFPQVLKDIKALNYSQNIEIAKYHKKFIIM